MTRKIKLNYDQAMEVLAMHLESLGAIHPDERVNITPFRLEHGMITIYIQGGTHG